jgi:hypothetical protein
LRRLADAVKAGGLRRHLDGWQLGAVSLGIALSFSLLAIPRPSRPDVLPLPVVDRAEEARAAARARELTTRAAAEPLPFDVRAVGEQVRRYGAASAAGDEPLATAARGSAPSLAAHALGAHGAEPLARLLAVQTELFAASIEDWEKSGRPSSELNELGGDFLERARDKGWLAGDRLLMDPGELRTAFKMRWLELTGLGQVSALRPSLNEWRIHYRLLLRLSPPSLDAERDRERKLAVVAALGRRDPSYEMSLARGALLYQLGSYSDAAEELRSHLARHPDGRWHLRARNYLLAALEASGQTP